MSRNIIFKRLKWLFWLVLVAVVFPWHFLAMWYNNTWNCRLFPAGNCNFPDTKRRKEHLYVGVKRYQKRLSDWRKHGSCTKRHWLAIPAKRIRFHSRAIRLWKDHHAEHHWRIGSVHRGDLIINGRSTKDFKDRDWDTYRNHSIGFVFQSYNLIPHQTVLQNVELALTLSGVSKAERRKRAKKHSKMWDWAISFPRNQVKCLADKCSVWQSHGHWSIIQILF